MSGGRSPQPVDLALAHGPGHVRGRSTGSFDFATSPITQPSKPLLEVVPEPAFIAPAAATQIVTNNHAGFVSSLDEDEIVSAGTGTIPVTGPALRLVNQFLDYLLFSFIANSRSTSLMLLRPAIHTILNTKMAQEAIMLADEELHLYLGRDDEDVQSGDSDIPFTDWEVESIWKQARLRCMVYSSLGDLEEDDELAQIIAEPTSPENQPKGEHIYRNTVSPAVAIWLTSVLEFVGEQSLQIAGQATVNRFSALRLSAINDENSGRASVIPGRLAVEELDTEKVALNPALGRMWRQWRKRVRGKTSSVSLASNDFVYQQGSPSTSERSQSSDWQNDRLNNGRTISPVTSHQFQQDDRPRRPDTQYDQPHSDAKEALQAETGFERNGADMDGYESLVDELRPARQLTPIWEAGSSVDGDGSDITDFEELEEIVDELGVDVKLSSSFSEVKNADSSTGFPVSK